MEGTKREYASSRDWSWDAFGRAVLKKNKREKFANVTGESTNAGSKVLLAENPFFEADQDWQFCLVIGEQTKRVQV